MAGKKIARAMRDQSDLPLFGTASHHRARKVRSDSGTHRKPAALKRQPQVKLRLSPQLRAALFAAAEAAGTNVNADVTTLLEEHLECYVSHKPLP
jgi:hypothetical protein